MYQAIFASVSSIEIIQATPEEVWFTTQSPGELDPIVMVLSNEQVSALHTAIIDATTHEQPTSR
jgi:hypothetical protein